MKASKSRRRKKKPVEIVVDKTKIAGYSAQLSDVFNPDKEYHHALMQLAAFRGFDKRTKQIEKFLIFVYGQETGQAIRSLKELEAA